MSDSEKEIKVPEAGDEMLESFKEKGAFKSDGDEKLIRFLISKTSVINKIIDDLIIEMKSGNKSEEDYRNIIDAKKVLGSLITENGENIKKDKLLKVIKTCNLCIAEMEIIMKTRKYNDVYFEHISHIKEIIKMLIDKQDKVEFEKEKIKEMSAEKLGVVVGREFMRGDVPPDEDEAMWLAAAHGVLLPHWDIVGNGKGKFKLVVCQKGEMYNQDDIFNDVSEDVDRSRIHGKEISLSDYAVCCRKMQGIFDSLKISFGAKKGMAVKVNTLDNKIIDGDGPGVVAVKLLELVFKGFNLNDRIGQIARTTAMGVISDSEWCEKMLEKKDKENKQTNSGFNMER